MPEEAPHVELHRIKRMIALLEEHPDDIDEEHYNKLVQRHNELIDIVDPEGLIF